jgi:hypothetical protein
MKTGTWKWQARSSLWFGQAKACPIYGADSLGAML